MSVFAVFSCVQGEAPEPPPQKHRSTGTVSLGPSGPVQEVPRGGEVLRGRAEDRGAEKRAEASRRFLG